MNAMQKKQPAKQDNLEKDWEDTEPKQTEPREPKEWVCIKKCYCPRDKGNPITSKVWDVGEAHWALEPPSKHFITRQEYDAGAGGKSFYFQKIQKFGGRVTEQTKALNLKALQQYTEVLEREFLRKQATI